MPLTACVFNQFFPSTEGFLLQNKPWPICGLPCGLMLVVKDNTENPMTDSSGFIPISC